MTNLILHSRFLLLSTQTQFAVVFVHGLLSFVDLECIRNIIIVFIAARCCLQLLHVYYRVRHIVEARQVFNNRLAEVPHERALSVDCWKLIRELDAL